MAPRKCRFTGKEPSPKGFGRCAHLEREGTVARGTKGEMWIVKTNIKGVKSWKKLLKENSPKPNPTPKPPKNPKNPKTPKNPKKTPNKTPTIPANATSVKPKILKKPMLAQKYDGKMDPKGMWVSEKLDGVRAMYIDGHFLSRNGNRFAAPTWFVNAMPKNVELDGELYTKRGDFQKIMSIVSKKRPVDAEWRTIKYMAFDVPISGVPFERRYDMLKRIVRDNRGGYLKLVENFRVTSRNHMESFHRQIIAKGGEGLMLRVHGSLYQSKRTNDLLKVKKDQDDEAVVIGHLKGSGKNASRLGKLVVKWKHCKESFHVGTGFTDKQRDSYKRLFPVGSVIKIKFNGLTEKKKPRFPVFIGLRNAIDI